MYVLDLIHQPRVLQLDVIVTHLKILHPTRYYMYYRIKIIFQMIPHTRSDKCSIQRCLVLFSFILLYPEEATLLYDTFQYLYWSTTYN